jgi:hypothetical protein
MRRSVCPALLAVVLAAAPAAAQSYAQVKGMDERFRLDVGGFFQDFSTAVRIDSANGPGTDISFEDDLGLDSSKTSFRLDGYWRFGRRGRVDFAYTSYRRSNDRVLDRQITVGDTVYDVGASVYSETSVSVAELYYAWSLLNTGEAEVSVMLGASTFINKFEFEGTGYVTGGGGGTASSFQREETDLVVPIPAIGASVRYTLLPGFMAHGRVRWMKATIDQYTGSMLDWRAGLDYFFTKNFGVGAVWTSTDIDVEKEMDKGNVAFSYKFDGPVGYLSFTF